MNFSYFLDGIMGEFVSILHQVDAECAEKLVDEIISSERIFITGMGRSGLAARPFAMRLMQMGVESYMVGDVTSPAITERDLLIAISGSGETEITYHVASTARNFGARVFLLTANASSKIADVSDLAIVIPGSPDGVLPLGSAFEGAVYILLDVVVSMIMERTKISQEDMMRRHSNLE